MKVFNIVTNDNCTVILDDYYCFLNMKINGK